MVLQGASRPPLDGPGDQASVPARNQSVFWLCLLSSHAVLLAISFDMSAPIRSLLHCSRQAGVRGQERLNYLYIQSENRPDL